MGRSKANKEEDKKEVTPEEVVETPAEITPSEALIPSKLFVKKLKAELKEKSPKEQISEPIFTAFIASVPKVDSEDNYRKIWKSTFSRK